MPSYIANNRRALSRRHYIRKATTDTYWFDFTESKVHDYITQFGERFCLVVFGSESHDDAYIMPFSRVKRIFSQQNIEPRRGRWIGTIRGGVMHVGADSLDVAAYHNAAEHLDAKV
jgi:hypothetical protein